MTEKVGRRGFFKRMGLAAAATAGATLPLMPTAVKAKPIVTVRLLPNGLYLTRSNIAVFAGGLTWVDADFDNPFGPCKAADLKPIYPIKGELKCRKTWATE